MYRPASLTIRGFVTAAPQPLIQLNNGIPMPAAICGTYVGDDRGHTSAASAPALVTAALEAGYRHFDTALMYNNEVEIGGALRCGGAVDTAFVTTKVAHPNVPARGHFSCSFMYDAAVDATEGVLRNVEASVERLGLQRPVDLVLVHWPGEFGSSDADFNERKRWEMWNGLERALDAGLCRAIGVSNFTACHLRQLLARGPAVVPAVNQVQVNPRHANEDVVTFSHSRGLAVTAWSPFGLGGALNEPAVVEIAAAHVTSPSAVVLQWLLRRMVFPIPRSVDPNRIRSNFAAVTRPGFFLTDVQVAAIDTCDRFPEGSAIPCQYSPEKIA